MISFLFHNSTISGGKINFLNFSQKRVKSPVGQKTIIWNELALFLVHLFFQVSLGHFVQRSVRLPTLVNMVLRVVPPQVHLTVTDVNVQSSILASTVRT
jgi:hypothetical protein